MFKIRKINYNYYVKTHDKINVIFSYIKIKSYMYNVKRFLFNFKKELMFY